jgi:Pyruvate/2-oxoacid:ferredoxin oxidoreductase gamma subunit
MNIDRRIWVKIIENSFPEKLVKMNINAFQMGIDA